MLSVMITVSGGEFIDFSYFFVVCWLILPSWMSCLIFLMVIWYCWWLLFLSRWRRLGYKGRNISKYMSQLRMLNLLLCQFHLVTGKDFLTGLLFVPKSLGNWSWFGLCFAGFDKICFYYLFYHYLYLDFRWVV